jgi:L-ascorbate metabolism protein UlaG (beta-lactamase superfamily)
MFGILGNVVCVSHAMEKSQEMGKVQVQMIGFGVQKITSPKGKVILTDPWLSANDFFPEGNPAIPEKYKKDVGAFSKVDIVLITHAHFDHLNLKDLVALCDRFNPVVIAPVETACYISSKVGLAEKICNGGFGMSRGPLAPIDGIQITGVHAEHTSSEVGVTEEGSLMVRDLGDSLGYIITLENGFKIYFSGDTGLCSDMKFIIGDYYQPDLVILNICGGGFTIGGDSAAYAIQMIQPKYVIPAHYGVFPMMDQTPDEFLEALKQRAPDVKAFPLQPEESVEF